MTEEYSEETRQLLVHVLDKGKARTATLEEGRASIDSADIVWFHYDFERGAVLSRDETPVPMPDIARDALTAFETRPRSERIDEGAIVNLRGLGDIDQYNGDPLVSLRMWAERNVLVSASFRPLLAVPPVAEAFCQGAYSDVGDVITALADMITEELDPRVAMLGDKLDDIESVLETSPKPILVRRRVSLVRSKAISYRRFIAPQRAALERLAGMELDWLDETDRVKIRLSADRCARMAEELEAVRERAAVAHEELTDLRAEKIDGRSLFLSIIALIFLPLTFLTGLLGMNVEGIPFAKEPWAFWGVTGLCLVIAVGIAGWFAIRRWYSN